ncbi:unnamed protein product [Aphanomyces euteiches]|uniref:BZIP domain-containing protein n=1 Tax=Aphanomyces euteiches TaxID=100861 RepID=A0A6G0WC99_9STRA|nr:hypothetical protein Ae201684_016522 [Aphanomyces euteiches]KAH9092510.1 hypothetical protein Ae201684P_008185 [Aphanomyces euteiches]KAH9143717.1 hypothetical protein AeRB84_012305 [Aphanomyces euteiches]
MDDTTTTSPRKNGDKRADTTALDANSESSSDSEQKLEDKKLRRRAQIAKSARKHRIRQKSELQNLRKQVQDLQEALAKANCTSCLGMLDNPTGDDKPVSLRGLWLHAPLETDPGPGPNILHAFHHLPIDVDERRSKLLAIAKPGPLRMYTQILDETRSIPSFVPYVDARMTSLGAKTSIKFCRVCEITSFDHKTVSDMFWSLFWSFDDHGKVEIPGVCQRQLLSQLDETSHYEHVSYSVPNLPNVRLESFDVISRLSLPAYTIFTWESVDRDDAFPPTETAHTIRREEIGGVLFQTEMDAAGQLRTVLRTVVYSRPFVSTLPKTWRDMNEPFLHHFCRLNVMAEEQVSRRLLETLMTPSNPV